MSEPDYFLTVVTFLESIGIKVEEGTVPEEAILPGIWVQDGGLLVERAKLAAEGDLLHEAGHIATAAPSERAGLNGNMVSDQAGEMVAIAWSFAAAEHIGLPIELLFHADGYKGDSAGMIRNFSGGSYVGAPMLSWYRMTGAPGEEVCYPKMESWVREVENPEEA